MAEYTLETYPVEYLECRVDRHHWGRPIWELVGANTSDRTQQCGRCGMKRIQQISTKTWTRRGGYRYIEPPQGYYTRKAGLTLDDFRRVLFERDFGLAQKEGRVE